MKEKLEAFLADLKVVYEKHGMVISACGCCDSPFVRKRESYCCPGDPIEDAIDHLRGLEVE